MSYTAREAEVRCNTAMALLSDSPWVEFAPELWDSLSVVGRENVRQSAKSRGMRILNDKRTEPDERAPLRGTAAPANHSPDSRTGGGNGTEK